MQHLFSGLFIWRFLLWIIWRGVVGRRYDFILAILLERLVCLSSPFPHGQFLCVVQPKACWYVLRNGFGSPGRLQVWHVPVDYRKAALFHSFLAAIFLLWSSYIVSTHIPEETDSSDLAFTISVNHVPAEALQGVSSFWRLSDPFSSLEQGENTSEEFYLCTLRFPKR